MALLDNIENLPTPVKLAAAGGAVVGVVVFLLNRNKTPQPSPATETAQSKVPPIYQLPLGAVQSGGGGGLVPTPTPPDVPSPGGVAPVGIYLPGAPGERPAPPGYTWDEFRQKWINPNAPAGILEWWDVNGPHRTSTLPWNVPGNPGYVPPQPDPLAEFPVDSPEYERAKLGLLSPVVAPASLPVVPLQPRPEPPPPPPASIGPPRPQPRPASG